MKEKKLHPIVRDFLINKKNCIAATIHCGHRYVGYADAFGIKDIGGEYESEMIGYAVEVKKWRAPFGKNIGQALGYSLFSHRCYLAVPNDDLFEEEDKEMANRLGIGLIQIDVKKKSCEEILTAKHQQPIEALFLSAAEELGYSKCSICKEFFKSEDSDWSKKPPSNALKQDRHHYVRIEKEVFYTKSKGRRPVYICKSCLKNLEYDK
ncbi:MAG: hypothetical protein KKA79_09455 [Nanoarchaeota archaeon]|nr:hypothetical protein [Nanoarchaeota archaeon]MCG2717266.1 hypothetical protein [Nanoarchaeota archaeon]